MALLLGLLILCLAWLAPNHYHPWVSFQQEWAASVGALLVGYAAVWAVSREQRVKWPALASFVLVVAGVPLLQWWAGQILFTSDAVLSALYLGGVAMAMVAGSTLRAARPIEFVGGLFGAFLIAGIVSTGMAAGQWLEIGPIGYVGDLAPGSRPYANLAQPNHLATLLALALVGLVWLFETRRVGPATTALGALWLGAGLVLTQSRTGWIFVFAFGASVFLMRRRVSLRTRPAAALVAVGMFAAAVMLLQPLANALLLSSADSLQHRLTSSPRLLLWRAFIDALQASPWTGYGWTQVRLAAQAASLDLVTQQGLFVNAHNLVLDLLLWVGVPLGLLIVGVLAHWFVRQVRECRDIGHWLLLSAVSAIFIHAMFEYPLEYAYFLLPAGLLMGALDGSQTSAPIWRAPRWTLAVPLILFTGMIGWIGAEYMLVEEASRQLRMVMAGIGVDKVPYAPPPQVRLLDAPREYHRYMMTPARPGMSLSELDWAKRVVARNPSPPAQLRYALAAGLNGRSTEAVDTLTRLCFMHEVLRCKEGQAAWAQLQMQYPQLQAIPFPRRAAQVVADIDSPPH